MNKLCGKILPYLRYWKGVFVIKTKETKKGVYYRGIDEKYDVVNKEEK